MLCVLGECLIDLVAEADGATFTAHPGGSPLNIAVGLGRLGHDTSLLARLSSDTFGQRLREHAARNALDLSLAIPAGEPTTLAVASLDEAGKARYDFYVTGTADWQWQAHELATLPREVTLLHTGSLSAWTEPGATLIADLCRRLQAEGRVLLSYDPNVRPALLGERHEAAARIEQSVATAHVVKASDEDIEWLYPGSAEAEVAERWLALGAALVVVTRGAEGAVAYRTGHPALEHPGRVVALVDTVGAGDAFMSGLLSALVDLDFASPTTLRDISDADLGQVMTRAILVSALTCERAGANPPTRAELEVRR